MNQIPEKLEKALSKVLVFLPALGYFSSGWKKILSTTEATLPEEVQTMAVDYENLYYNPEFVESLTEEQLAAVLIHEITHCMFLHPSELTKAQLQGKNPYLWEIALELVTNANTIALIKAVDAPFTLPGVPFSPLKDKLDVLKHKDVYFYDPLAEVKSAEEIYRELEKKFSQSQRELLICLAFSQSGQSQEGGQGVCSSNKQSSDRQKRMENQNQSGKVQQQNEPKESQSQKAVSGPERSDKHSNLKGRIILSGDILSSTDKAIEQEVIEKTIAILEKLSSQTMGHLPGGLQRLLKKLKDAKTPWWRILHGFVGSIISGMNDISWLTPDFKHHLSKDIVLPGPYDIELDDVVVVIDTSGSISQEQLTRFASEIVKLYQYVSELVIITTDIEVCEKVKTRNARELLTKVRFRGGGGTDFSDVFKKIKKCQCMIFLTDGYARYPKRKPVYPVLWILTKEHESPPFGKVAYILEE